MGKKREESQRPGAGVVLFFLVILFWLVASHPWLLLLPIAFWFCFIRPKPVEKARRRSPPQPVAPAPAARPAPKLVKAVPPGLIPKDREYNRYLARTWDEEFEALVRKREHVPPS